MKDILDNLAIDVRAFIVETCAKVAELHRNPDHGPPDENRLPVSEYERGYNTAVFDIARKIRQLNAKE